MFPAQQSRSFLEPQVLSRLAAIPLFARRPMQGSVSGRHPSPHRGSSVEFAEYRKYVPGDDLRRLDWRGERPAGPLYLKEVEARPHPPGGFFPPTTAPLALCSPAPPTNEYTPP